MPPSYSIIVPTLSYSNRNIVFLHGEEASWRDDLSLRRRSSLELKCDINVLSPPNSSFSYLTRYLFIFSSRLVTVIGLTALYLCHKASIFRSWYLTISTDSFFFSVHASFAIYLRFAAAIDLQPGSPPVKSAWSFKEQPCPTVSMWCPAGCNCQGYIYATPTHPD